MQDSWIVFLASVSGAALAIIGTLAGSWFQRRLDREARLETRLDDQRQAALEVLADAYEAASDAVAHLRDPDAGLHTAAGRVTVEQLLQAVEGSTKANRLLWRAEVFAPDEATRAALREANARLGQLESYQTNSHNIMRTLQGASPAQVEATLKPWRDRFKEAMEGIPGAPEGPLRQATVDEVLEELRQRASRLIASPSGRDG